MPGQSGIRQSDIPKVMGFIESGLSAKEIANGMLGYRCPEPTIQSFIDHPPSKNSKAVSHPQDRKAADKAEKGKKG